MHGVQIVINNHFPDSGTGRILRVTVELFPEGSDRGHQPSAIHDQYYGVSVGRGVGGSNGILGQRGRGAAQAVFGEAAGIGNVGKKQ